MHVDINADLAQYGRAEGKGISSYGGIQIGSPVAIGEMHDMSRIVVRTTKPVPLLG